MQVKRINPKDLMGGALMLVLGLGTMWQADQYDLGSLRRMGPGFFPMALGVILAVLGVLIMLTSRKAVNGDTRKEALPPEWLGWGAICLGIALFVILGKYGGLVPATFACVFVSALGDKRNTWRSALILGVAMSVVAAVVFRWLLMIQFPLFTWG
jgi:hypothetical protein